MNLGAGKNAETATVTSFFAFVGARKNQGWFVARYNESVPAYFQ